MADFLTAEEYYQYSGLASPVEDRIQIGKIITAISQYITQLIGRDMTVTTSSAMNELEYFKGKGLKYYFPKQGPVQSVSKIEYWDGNSWQECDTDTMPYETDGNQIFFTAGDTFFKPTYRPKNWRVTYTWALDEVPEDLKMAVAMTIDSFVVAPGMGDIISQTDGEQSFTYNSTLRKVVPVAAINIINLYRRFSS